MVKQLEAIRDRLSRAEEHLKAINRGLLRHYEADEYLMAGEYQRNSDAPGGRGDIVIDPTTLPEINPRLNTLIGEYVHDLRSGLDHLAWQLVLRAKGTPTVKTCFPIKDSDPGADKKGRPRTPGVAGGVSVAARTVIREAQPYQWGSRYSEHPLWLLHQLWNIDKHRYVIAKGSFSSVVLPLGAPSFRFTSRLDVVAPHSARLMLVPDDPNVNVDAHATVAVAIHEPDYGIEQPLLRTLEDISQAVERIIQATEATCF